MDSRTVLRVAFTLLLIPLFHLTQSFAEEGFFLPDQVPTDQIRETYGVTLTPEDIHRLSSGVVSIRMQYALKNEGMGSGSIISPDGLVLTNHHVVQDCFEDLKTLGHLSSSQTSFAASSYSAELPCRSHTLHLYKSAYEVTEVIRSALATVSDAEKSAKSETIWRELLLRCEGFSPEISDTDYEHQKSQASVHCRGKTLASLQRAWIEKYDVIRDVRLVYMPAQHDLSRAQWPLYNIDFALLRAYGTAMRRLPPCVDCDEASDYGLTFSGFIGMFDFASGSRSSGTFQQFMAGLNNQPLDTSAWFLPPETKTSVSANDFVMTVGFPGPTHRFASPYETHFQEQVVHPLNIAAGQAGVQTLSKQLDLLMGLETPEAIDQRMCLESLRSSAYCQLAQWMAMTLDWQESNSTERATQRFGQLQTALKNHPALKEKYGEGLKTLAQVAGKRKRLYPTVFWTQFLQIAGVFAIPTLILKSVETLQTQPNHPFSISIRDGFIENLEASSELLAVAQSLLQAVIHSHRQEHGFRIPLIARLMEEYGDHEGDPSDEELAQDIVQDVVSRSRLFTDKDFRKSLFTLTPQALRASDDPLLALVYRIQKVSRRSTTRYKTLTAQQEQLEKAYQRALWESAPTAMPYFDANTSLRVSYGRVQGYTGPATLPILYPAVSRFSDFLSPAKIFGPYSETQLATGKKAAALFGDIPVNFVSTVDIMRGSSGSPIINAHRKVTGVAYAFNAVYSADTLYLTHRPPAVSISLPFILNYIDKDMAGHLSAEEPFSGAFPPTRITEEIRAAERGESCYTPEPAPPPPAPTTVEAETADSDIPPPPPLPAELRAADDIPPPPPLPEDLKSK